MRPRIAVGLALVALLLGACREPDPVAEVMAQRSLYTVELSGWSWVDGAHTRQALLNLRVTCGCRPGLSDLTVVVEEVDADGETVIKSRLGTLHVADLEYDLPRDLILKIDDVDPAVDEGGFAVFVDPAPPTSDWSSYPELKGLVGSGSAGDA